MPDDLLLVCCSESDVYATTEPPITTLSLKPRKIGTTVVNLLIDAIEGVDSGTGVDIARLFPPRFRTAGTGPPPGTLMPTELIVRASSQRRSPRTTVSPPRPPGEV